MRNSVVDEDRVNITVFLGAPGSGKGTQAKRLAQAHGFMHFSTGDMLRAAIQAGAEVGKKAKVYIDKGELVPDAVMIELIEDSLGKLGPDSKVLLDGFPRTVPQAEALDRKKSTSVARALYFMVPEKMLINRLTGRRVCQKCGEPFHVTFLPPKVAGACDRCGGMLIQRSDDTESVVRRRLEVFSQQNEGLLAYYGAKQKLRKLDADKPIESIQKDLIHLLQ